MLAFFPILQTVRASTRKKIADNFCMFLCFFPTIKFYVLIALARHSYRILSRSAFHKHPREWNFNIFKINKFSQMTWKFTHILTLIPSAIKKVLSKLEYPREDVEWPLNCVFPLSLSALEPVSNFCEKISIRAVQKMFGRFPDFTTHKIELSLSCASSKFHNLQNSATTHRYKWNHIIIQYELNKWIRIGVSGN